MLDDNTLKDLFSMAAIQAICANAGYQVDIPTRDNGLDGTIIDVQLDPLNKLEPTGAIINFQAKSTENIIVYEDYIAYPLRNKNYNILIKKRAQPMILILFVVPSDKNLWLNITEDYMQLHKCAYWIDLKGHGKPKENLLSNTTIHIPKSNILTPAVIEQLLSISRARLAVIDNLDFSDGGDL